MTHWRRVGVLVSGQMGEEEERQLVEGPGRHRRQRVETQRSLLVGAFLFWAAWPTARVSFAL